MRSRILVGSFMAILALTVGSACGGGSGGGGGGGPTIDNSTFSGSYVTIYMEQSVSNGTNISRFGRMATAGAGNVTPILGSNDAGTHTPVAAGPAVPYTVTSNAILTIPGETGAITADGAAAVLMNNIAASSPSMRFLLRTSGVYNNASFAGNFHAAGWAVGSQTIWTTDGGGTCVADGMGAMAEPNWDFRSGASFTPAGVAGGGRTYAMAADGTLTLDLTGNALRGGLSPDGTVAILGGIDSAGGFPLIAMLIKEAAGANNATFNGSYLAVGLSTDPDDANNATSFVGTVTADGAGAMNYIATTENFEGVISNPSGPDNYSVAANGRFTSGQRIGAISQDGRFAFLCGEDDDANAGTTEFPTLFIFVRQ